MGIAIQSPPLVGCPHRADSLNDPGAKNTPSAEDLRTVAVPAQDASLPGIEVEHSASRWGDVILPILHRLLCDVYPFPADEIIGAEDHDIFAGRHQSQGSVPLCAQRIVAHYAEMHAVTLTEFDVFPVTFGASCVDGEEGRCVGKEEFAYLWATVEARDDYHG